MYFWSSKTKSETCYQNGINVKVFDGEFVMNNKVFFPFQLFINTVWLPNIRILLWSIRFKISLCLCCIVKWKAKIIDNVTAKKGKEIVTTWWLAWYLIMGCSIFECIIIWNTLIFTELAGIRFKKSEFVSVNWTPNYLNKKI